MWKSWENLTWNLTDLSISPVKCSHFTFEDPKVIFRHYYSYTSDYLRYLRRKQIESVYLLLFSASYYLHSPSTASGAHYRRSACNDMDMLRLAVAACCDMGWISTERGVLCDRSVSKNTVSIILMHKVVTLNTCCDIACLTFQLPHNITGFFSEPPTTTHNWLFSEPPSPTFERTQQTFSQIKKVVQFTSWCGDIPTWCGQVD